MCEDQDGRDRQRADLRRPAPGASRPVVKQTAIFFNRIAVSLYLFFNLHAAAIGDAQV